MTEMVFEENTVFFSRKFPKRLKARIIRSTIRESKIAIIKELKSPSDLIIASTSMSFIIGIFLSIYIISITSGYKKLKRDNAKLEAKKLKQNKGTHTIGITLLLVNKHKGTPQSAQTRYQSAGVLES